jgi:hypothetical protein
MNLKELVKEERGARKERGEESVQIIRYKKHYRRQVVREA